MVRCQGSRRVLSFLGLVGVALAWALLLVAGVLAVSQPGRAEFDGARPQHGDASVGSDTCLAMTGGVTYTVLQEAIDHAGALGKVYVATGTCYEALSIAKSVTLTGGWSRAFPSLSQDPNSQSIVNALGAGRVISISKPSATLVTVVVEGMTLTGGDATGLGGGTGATDIGGGIFAEGVDLTVRNCVVHGNVASSSRSGRGGGIGTELCGDVILVGNVITGNTASLSGSGQGGGIADRNGKVVLTGNTIEDNTAAAGGGEGRGGGIWLDSISGDLSGNIVRANTASEMGSGSGGGLRAEIVQALSVSGGAFEGNTASATGTGNGGAMSLDRCDSSVSAVLVVGNRATTGGGVWATGGSATLSRNYVLTNSAGASAGAAWLGGISGADLVNNVVAGNTVDALGAGIVVSGGSARLFHSTLALNSGGDGSGLLVTGGGSVWLTNTIAVSHTVAITAASGSSAVADATLWGVGSWANGVDLGGEAVSVGPDILGIPDFVEIAGKPYHIGRQSAALDAAIDAGVAEDIDGHVRPLGHGVDLGADEAVVIWLPLILRNAVPAGSD